MLHCRTPHHHRKQETIYKYSTNYNIVHFYKHFGIFKKYSVKLVHTMMQSVLSQMFCVLLCIWITNRFQRQLIFEINTHTGKDPKFYFQCCLDVYQILNQTQA